MIWIAGLAVGLATGGVFFLGLWATVQRLPTSPNPAALALGSFLARTGFVLVALYAAAQGRWEFLAACLVGFTVARFAVGWLVSEETA